jgi:hypothetical protein
VLPPLVVVPVIWVRLPPFGVGEVDSVKKDFPPNEVVSVTIVTTSPSELVEYDSVILVYPPFSVVSVIISFPSQIDDSTV